MKIEGSKSQYSESSLRVKISLKNNHLLTLREKSGLTQEDLSKAIGISSSTYRHLENLTYPAITNGVWNQVALEIANYFDLLPETIFPHELLKIKKATTEFCADVEEIQKLSNYGNPFKLIENAEKGQAVRYAMATLTPREEKVLRKRNGFDGEPQTYEGIAHDMKCSTERARQIEQKALRKLRHPSRAKELFEHKTGEDNE